LIDEQEKTFKKLKQTPIEEMITLYNEFHSSLSKIAPVYVIGNVTIERKCYYPEIIQHNERINFLRQHGWEMDEYCLALEKRAILSQIELINQEYKVPREIVERAKTFWPNARFIQASIELE